MTFRVSQLYDVKNEHLGSSIALFDVGTVSQTVRVGGTDPTKKNTMPGAQKKRPQDSRGLLSLSVWF